MPKAKACPSAFLGKNKKTRPAVCRSCSLAGFFGVKNLAKAVLITGASRGIGAATAALFAKNGYRVAINYHQQQQRAEQLAAQLRQQGETVITVPGDVASPEQAKAVVDCAETQLGGLSVLVNNAGIAQQKLITDITNSDYDRMLGVNLNGVFYCCRAAAEYMLRRHAGSIVNVSSVWGVQGACMETHYSAAKAGVAGFTKALAKELGPSNIRVNCVAPGVIQTEMNANFSAEELAALADQTPLCRLGTADEVAEAIYFLAEKGSFITGQILGVDGGFC